MTALDRWPLGLPWMGFCNVMFYSLSPGTWCFVSKTLSGMCNQSVRRSSAFWWFTSKYSGGQNWPMWWFVVNILGTALGMWPSWFLARTSRGWAMSVQAFASSMSMLRKVHSSTVVLVHHWWWSSWFGPILTGNVPQQGTSSRECWGPFLFSRFRAGLAKSKQLWSNRFASTLAQAVAKQIGVNANVGVDTRVVAPNVSGRCHAPKIFCNSALASRKDPKWFQINGLPAFFSSLASWLQDGVPKNRNFDTLWNFGPEWNKCQPITAMARLGCFYCRK